MSSVRSIAHGCPFVEANDQVIQPEHPIGETMTANIVKRSIVSLNLPVSVPALMTEARAILVALTTNTATFPSPDPSIATLSTAISELESAESAVQARTRGAVSGRDEKRQALVVLLDQLKAYIQKVADANSDAGAQIIQSAGVAVRKVTPRQKQTFRARLGAVSGSVALTTVAPSRRASYEWESSTDGGKTWTPLPNTLQAKTTAVGFTPGVTATFRSRATTRVGEGDWTQPTSIVVR
jgi:hypothetical protein